MNNSTHLKECLGDLFAMKRTDVIVKYTPFVVELVINHLTHVHFSAWLRMLLITLIHISWSTSMYLLSHLWWHDFFDINFPTVLFSLIQINQIYSQRTVKAQAIEANKIILSNTFCAPFPMTNMPIFLWQANIENMLVTTRNIVQFSHHMFLWSYVQNSVDDEKRRYMVAKTMYRQYLLITTPLYQ